MQSDRSTLTQFLIEERRRHPQASGELNGLILNVALACKAIAKRVAYGALDGMLGSGEAETGPRRPLDREARDLFVRTTEWNGHLAGMSADNLELPHRISERYSRGKYLLVLAPLDGSSNLDMNLSLSSIFSILRAPRPGEDATGEDFRQPGKSQVCAGYAIYGPSTMLVITVGTGVHGFTLDPQLGEFILTHPALRIAPATSDFAINASSSRCWEPAVKRYVDECGAGQAGPRGKDFTMRWAASLVAQTHRILMRGGVSLYPRDTKDCSQPASPQLLYEASPLSLLIEQAGGLASNGYRPILEVQPGSLHERSGFLFGAREEVARLTQYYRDHNEREYSAPLFGSRGLYSSKS